MARTESCVFRCAHCGIALTPPLNPLPDRGMLSEERGTEYVPSGYYFISDLDFFVTAKGEFIVNLKDVINTRHHEDSRRLNGCCGLDGCDGKNTVCANGDEVGTEQSDCWMAHAMHFDPKAVERRSG